MPIKIIVYIEIFFDKENSNIMLTPNIPLIKENGKKGILILRKKSEINIARATPKDALAEIPKVNGSTSGFLNMVCKISPHTESIPPTKMASIILGILRLIIIFCSIDSALG